MSRQYLSHATRYRKLLLLGGTHHAKNAAGHELMYTLLHVASAGIQTTVAPRQLFCVGRTIGNTIMTSDHTQWSILVT